MKIMPHVSLLSLLALCGACAGSTGSRSAEEAREACPADTDGDGYGEGCVPGPDCDDDDPLIHVDCGVCVRPQDGCECASGSAPVSCFLPPTPDESGQLLCQEGTRYCRGGAWSGCEAIHTYPMPEQASSTAIIDPDAPPVQCSDCNVKCFVIRDNLDPVDGGLESTGDGTAWASGGGLQLGTTTTVFNSVGGVQDGGVVSGPLDCMLGTAPDEDCDGIPDVYDPYPGVKPFATANPAIFLNIAPGETGRGLIDLVFYMQTIDVYFLLDQTESMQSVKQKLHSSLVAGTFLGSEVECADSDLDGQPNQELKTQGVIGGIRCLLRNAHIGAGWFREIPFTNYGDADEVTFRHVLDMGLDANAALAAVGSFDVDRNNDWPDASPLALYSLATGNGLYMGVSKPGVPPRTGCPTDRWGYACFRPDALPVVLVFTDAPMHEGPTVPGQNYNYATSDLGITAGSSSTYVPIAPSNETFATAAALGNLASKYVSYSGTTASMASDYGTAMMSCVSASSQTGPDAVFTFSLGAATAFKVDTTGTGFSPAVGIYNHVVETPSGVTSPNTNETSVQATNLGLLTGSWVEVAGSTASMNADYTGSDVGCNADTASRDAVFKFSVGATTNMQIDSTGSSFDAVLGLYDGAPALTTPVTTSNTNETTTTAVDIGDVRERVYQVATASTAAMAADYISDEVGCSADNASPDALYKFSLSQATRVRIDTVGSSYDTVLGLSDGTLGTKTARAVTGADTQAAAYNLGEMLHGWYGLTGTTAGQVANYRQSFIGCNADTASPDSVVKFSLSQPTRVRLDTVGSALDTVISLHNGQIDPTTVVIAANTNETASNPQSLGSVDNAWYELSGGNTTAMVANYDGSITGCGGDTSSPDSVFSFTVGATSDVQIDTIGSTFNTVISLHDGLPPIDTVEAVSSGTESVTVGALNGTSHLYTGSTTGLASNYGGNSMGCSTADGAPDATFQFTVATATELELNTAGSGFDTVIGLYPATISSPTRPTATALSSNTNDRFTGSTGAYDLGTLDDKWLVRSGNTTNNTIVADYTGYCGAPNNAKDAMFKFTLATGRTVTIDTQNSTTDMVLQLYDSTQTYLNSCDDNSAGGTAAKITKALVAGTYYVALKGAHGNDKGAYELSVRDDAVKNAVGCNDNFGVSTSKLIAQVMPGTYNVLLKGATSSAAGSFKMLIRDNDYWAQTHRLTCDDNGGGGTASQINRNLAPGTYYIVVKGDLAADKGPYSLAVRATSSLIATSHNLACNDDASGSTTSSKIETDLVAGDYWVVVKGKSSTGGAYALEVRDIGATGQGSMLACDDDSGGGTASQIERDLAAGTYYVYVKGDIATDKGAYKLNVRDVTGVRTTPLACDDDSGGGNVAKITRSLTAGTYYVVLKGDAANDAGAYKVSLRDLSSATRTSYACSTSSSFTTNLAAGTYDLVLKGSAAAQKGLYSLTLGDGVTHSSNFTPPSWHDTLDALQDRDMRVISVLNCHDNGSHGEGRECDYAHRQAEDLANATDALGPNLETLVVDIDANGTGIENAIMTELTALSGHLEMDVSARLVFEPDANPGFVVSVQALETPGDNCDPPIGLEFQNCRPGATPHFVINITNPLDHPVQLNPNDPNGGYNFRADLIADRRYFVDAVPIYVIPEDVDGTVPDPEYALESMGEYSQNVTSPGCGVLTERPTWENLYWTADVPVGSSITFNVCTSDDPNALTACSYQQVATVSGTVACHDDTDCGHGFCAGNGVCQVITSGTCLNNDTCPSGSTCDPLVGTCVFSGQPVFVGSVLNGGNNLNSYAYLRMNIVLRANTTTNEGPVVHDWSLTYTCYSVN